MTGSRLVIFLHLPKAAGSTLKRDHLRQQYPPEAIYKTGGKSREPLLNAEVAEVTRPPSRVRLLAGHAGFGMHARAARGLSRLHHRLREPGRRLLSHYHFVARLSSASTARGDRTTAR